MGLTSELERLRYLEHELALVARTAGQRHPDREVRRICDAIAMQSETRASSAEAWAREIGEPQTDQADASIVLDLTDMEGGRSRGPMPDLAALRALAVRCDRAWAAVGAGARASGRSQLLDLVGAARADLRDLLTWLDLRPESEGRTSRAPRRA